MERVSLTQCIFRVYIELECKQGVCKLSVCFQCTQRVYLECTQSLDYLDIATSVASDVATSVASDIATSVASDIATSVYLQSTAYFETYHEDSLLSICLHHFSQRETDGRAVLCRVYGLRSISSHVKSHFNFLYLFTYLCTEIESTRRGGLGGWSRQPVFPTQHNSIAYPCDGLFA